MSKILIGTSGYSYKDWIGPVYPQGTDQRDFLSLYSKEFKIVELNFSYYKQPNAKMLDSMIKKSPEGFLFSIKAHRSLTHEADENMKEQATLFKNGISVLIDHKRIGAILFQFPYSFHYTDKNRKYLEILCNEFSNMPVALEFRSDEWVRESVIEEIRQRNFCFVNVDEPDLPKLIKPGNIVTSKLAYIRFHGRNKKNWWKGTNISRYDYLYEDSELIEWISRIDKMVEMAKILLVSFNNHYKGQAVNNARRFKELLVQRGFKNIS